MVRKTEDCIEILKSINFEDSTLFGFSIDIFKIRMLISWIDPGVLEEFGFRQCSDLCFDFRHVDSLILSIHKGIFGPPYLEDGELSAIDLAAFGFAELDLQIVGRGPPLSYSADGGQPVNQYQVNFPFRSNGSIQFRFSELRVGTFIPESLDN